ncbi:hypothetical protein ACFL2C_03020 [Patescibacteria group bacterium]
MRRKKFFGALFVIFLVGMGAAFVLSKVVPPVDKSQIVALVQDQDALDTTTPTPTKDNTVSGTSGSDNSESKPASGGYVCKINPDCDLETEYCHKSSCGDEEGVCKKTPTSCANDFLVVCSCDGKTYSNECNARKNGANIAKAGSC